MGREPTFCNFIDVWTEEGIFWEAAALCWFDFHLVPRVLGPCAVILSSSVLVEGEINDDAS